MKVMLITGSLTFFPLAELLRSVNVLNGIMLQKVLLDAHPQLEAMLNNMGIRVSQCCEDDREEKIRKMLIASEPDLVLVFGFSWLIPETFFEYTRYGFFNIHFSLLPSFKGPVPIFWQLRYGAEYTGITIHKMTSKPDDGPIALQAPVKITANDTNGLLNLRLASQCVAVVEVFLKQEKYLSQNFMKSHDYPSSYQARPEPDNLYINWSLMNSEEIMNLVRATNPVYGGAVTRFRKQELRIMEVSSYIDDMSKKQEKAYQPGRIVITEDDRLLVACAKGSVYLNIVGSPAGVMSGERWYKSLGVGPDELLGI